MSASTTTPAAGDTVADVDPGQALRPAKPPVGSGLSPLFGALVAVLVIALGVVGVQEAVYRIGLAHTSWTAWVLDRVSGRTATFTVVVLGVVLVVLGLLLLLVTFRPRPRRALALTATTGVYLRAGDLARLAGNRIDGADGVTDVTARATRRRLSVRVATVTPSETNDTLRSDVESRLEPLYDALESGPRLKVDIDNQDLS